MSAACEEWISAPGSSEPQIELLFGVCSGGVAGTTGAGICTVAAGTVLGEKRIERRLPVGRGPRGRMTRDGDRDDDE